MSAVPITRVWFTVKEVAGMTGVGETEVYTALRVGELQGYQKRRETKWRVHIDDINRWMRGERPTAPSDSAA